jgi:hypothetical protein
MSRAPLVLAAALLLLACRAGAQETRAAAPATQPSPVRHAELLPKDWASRDLEGRWVVYSNAVREAPDARGAWIEVLADTKDWAVLGWIAITEAGFPGGSTLENADAPNWVATVVWYARSSGTFPINDSHGTESARSAMKGRNAAVIRAWLSLHPEALTPDLADRVGAIETTAEDARRAALQIPPLEPDQVFAGLSPPESVVEFGSRTRAAPGEFYVHQVRRSLAAFSYASQFHVEPWMGRVMALLVHKNPAVRQEALLGLTMMAPSHLPVFELIAIERDAKQEAHVREAAVMALSFALETPAAWAEVHRVAMDPAHPGFKAALSRLGDVGDRFSFRRLEGLRGKPGIDEALLGDVLARVGHLGVWGYPPFSTDLHPPPAGEQRAVRILMRAAHLALTTDPLASEYVAWMKVALAGQANDVAGLRDGFEVPKDARLDGFAPSGQRIVITPAEVRDSVRAFADLVLEAAATRPK